MQEKLSAEGSRELMSDCDTVRSRGLQNCSSNLRRTQEEGLDSRKQRSIFELSKKTHEPQPEVKRRRSQFIPI